MRRILTFINFLLILYFCTDSTFSQAYYNGEIGISVDNRGRVRIHSPELNKFQIDRFSILVGGNQDEVFDYLNDAASVDSAREVGSPQSSDTELYVSIDNHFPQTLEPPKKTLPPNVLVTLNVYGWNTGGYALIKYSITNKDSTAIELKPGFEILPQIDNDYGFEGIFYDNSTGYLRVRRGLTSTNVGMKVLPENLNSLTAFNWYEGYNSSDIALYNWLHSENLPENFQSDNNGLVGIVSLEPKTLEPDESRIVYIALAVGEYNTLSEILAQAESKYWSLFSSLKEFDTEMPANFKLSQNYPNPFNPQTRINFTIPERGNIILRVFNNLGEEVSTLFEGELSAGTYIYNFEANNLSSGIYYYTITNGLKIITKKMLLLK